MAALLVLIVGQVGGMPDHLTSPLFPLTILSAMCYGAWNASKMDMDNGLCILNQFFFFLRFVICVFECPSIATHPILHSLPTAGP